MGALVNVPVALAPGMGLNGYFNTLTKNVCWGPEVNPGSGAQDLVKYFPTDCPSWGKTSLPWSDAMGAVFISGWFYLFFTFTGLRSMLFRAVPKSLRAAICVGIGFFITIIGLKIGEITRVTQQPWSIGSVVSQAVCHTVVPIGNYSTNTFANGGDLGTTSSTDFGYITDGVTKIAFCDNQGACPQ